MATRRLNTTRRSEIVPIALATRNQGKLRECRELLAPLGLEVRSLADLAVEGEVEETGTTYAENALLKARAGAEATGLLTLADDSGLEVDALGGEPGVHSVRWAGPGVDDAGRNQRLLARLAGTPYVRRGARFVSVVAVCRPDGATALTRGELVGRIAPAPRGTQGFGYDPLFLLPDLDRTVAELSPREKNERSHRARAMQAMLPVLRTLLDP